MKIFWVIEYYDMTKEWIMVRHLSPFKFNSEEEALTALNNYNRRSGTLYKIQKIYK